MVLPKYRNQGRGGGGGGGGVINFMKSFHACNSVVYSFFFFRFGVPILGGELFLVQLTFDLLIPSFLVFCLPPPHPFLSRTL